MVFYFALLILSTGFITAETGKERITNYYTYGKSFIFAENGVTFSVYPDGEFDFYINDRVNVGAQLSYRQSSLTFNSGYNYNPYVQYDDYGAVVQVQNVGIYYDYYGRVSQIGNVNIWYRNNRVRRIGGLNIYYNSRGYFNYYTGYVNLYNRYYAYSPYHGYFVRPAVGYCQVYTTPYRRYYYPVRYTYYRPYNYNYRRAYATVGKPYNYYDRGYHRSNVYRNDQRVAVRKNYKRNEYGHNKRSDGYASNRTQARRRAESRSNTDRATNSSRNRINRSGTVRNSDQGRKTVNRTMANRSSNRINRKHESVKTNTRSIKDRKEVPHKRSQAITRSTKTSRKSSTTRSTGRSYNSKPKSSATVTSRPVNRTARKGDVAKSSSSKRSNSKGVERSSRSNKKGSSERSNSRRVR